MRVEETRWATRCADCQSAVPDLTAAVDDRNTRRALIVIAMCARSQEEAAGARRNEKQ